MHICSKTLSQTNKKLIADIAEQCQKSENIILAVTGDIVNKGEYGKYHEGVIAFFTELKKVLQRKVKYTYIVPGNHDKCLTQSSKLFAELVQEGNLEIDDNIWQLQEEGYKEYLNVATEIKQIFGKKRTQKKAKTFYVDNCVIDKQNICVILLDTTWGSNGSAEEAGKLVLGKYQLQSLQNEYNSIKDKIQAKQKDISLTICLAHHPISWLKPEEEKMMRKYMNDDEYLNVDLYLCGHIHDTEIENWFNYDHSVLTLVTGVGWNHQNVTSGERDKKEEHRYSIYKVDPEKNCCEIIVRCSKRNGKFADDTSLYTNSNEQKENKLCYPVRLANNRQPYIKLNAPIDRNIKNILVDDNVLDKIKHVSLCIAEFEKKCIEISYFYKRNYLERIEEFYDITSQTYEETHKQLVEYFFSTKMNNYENDSIFKENPDISYELFTSYLQEISMNFVQCFIACFGDSANLRCHFRWYDENDDTYKQLCKYSYKEHDSGPVVTKMPWGGLIEQAFKSRKSLIYSVNPEYNSITPVKWDDFMTIIPSFFKSEQEFWQNKKKIKRPIITCGISVQDETKSKKDISEILYVLEYLGVDIILTKLLDDFVSCFTVDYNDYLKYIKRIETE